MAKILAFNGHTINVVAGGAVASGDVDTIGGLIGVALNSGGTGDTIVYALSGVWELTKASADTFGAGDEVGITGGEIAQLGTGSYAMEASSAGAGVIKTMINGNPAA